MTKNTRETVPSEWSVRAFLQSVRKNKDAPPSQKIIAAIALFASGDDWRFTAKVLYHLSKRC